MDTSISRLAALPGLAAASSRGSAPAPAEAKTQSEPAPVRLVGSADSSGTGHDLQDLTKPSERAVALLNDFIKSQQQQLEFSMDKATNRIVLRVIDTSSGELIRQVPSEDWLHLAQSLANGRGGALLQDQA